MIGSDIVEKSYRLTNSDSATFLDGNSTNIYKDLNTAYGHRILDILRVRVDKNASIQEAKTTLVSTVGLVSGDNGYNGEYAFPADLLRPTRFEVSYDGLIWIKCKIYDNAINEWSEFNDTQINDNFSQSEPRVDFTRNSYKVRPLKSTPGNIVNGIYIEYEKRQADFTSSTSPSEIEANLQDILAYDLAELEIIMHPEKYTNQFLQIFNKKKSEVEQRFLEFYATRFTNKKRMTFNFKSLRR